tara:strand:- start:1407 stop:2294 length:888 start_codon:yes stop_codon:yes gene_type:complete
MNFTEEQLARWAAAPSQSERDRMDNAERAVRNAIAGSTKLNSRNIRVFAQGSYRNRVNVRADSDVDVAVACSDSFFWTGPAGATLQSLGYGRASYLYSDFRREVGEALISHFGVGSVTPGDKAFDIKANTYRVDADVAPFFEHRRFDAEGGFLAGVEMRIDSGRRIINWPDQHYDNGVSKNQLTGRAYKGCVRILKTLRYAMIADGIQSAKNSTSFLMECLVYNVANSQLGSSSWTENLRSCLANLYSGTSTPGTCSEWREVSELKYLFHDSQPWTLEGAHQFLFDCWNYVGFKR